MLLCLPKQVFAFLLYKSKKISKKEFKERFFCFLKKLVDVGSLIEQFWEENIDKFADWYIDSKNETDIVISASPEFLVKSAIERIDPHITVIASLVDPGSGEFYSDNCYGDVKVQRLYEDFPSISIGKFYSDSKSDLPLARLAKESYIVKNGKPTPWFDS